MKRRQIWRKSCCCRHFSGHFVASWSLLASVREIWVYKWEEKKIVSGKLRSIYTAFGDCRCSTLHFNFVIFNYQTQCPLTSWVHSMTNVLLVMVVVRRGASAACRDLQWSALQSPKDDHHLCHILWLMVVLMCRLDCLYYLHHFTSHFLVFSCWSGRLGKKVSWRRGEKKCIVNEWISAALIWFDLICPTDNAPSSANVDFALCAFLTNNWLCQCSCQLALCERAI